MKQYTVNHVNHASLAAFGQSRLQREAWEVVEEQVRIGQKTVRYRPIDKLQDIFIHILSGGKGLVEVNTGLRSQLGLQRAFGRRGCGEQSTLSQTLNACTEQNVEEMRQALSRVYQQHSQTSRHDYVCQPLLLDVDLTGMPAGRQGEGVTKGFFSEYKHRRGRQLGRVLSTHYDEIVVEQLYPGNVQLEKSMQDLFSAAEEVLQLDAAQRRRTIVRLDGGAGDDKDVNWLLERGYGLIAKVKNWQRSRKLAKTVQEWYPDPKEPTREVGWVAQPHEYVSPTRQLAIRSKDDQGQWRYRVLVFNLDDQTLLRLAKQSKHQAAMWLAMQVYDLRGGGVETSNRNSKSGLGITQRNKHKFAAQEMLMLLAELAYNLLSWFRLSLSQKIPRFARYGMQRLLRDVLRINGKVHFDRDGNLRRITLNRDHCLAKSFSIAFANLDQTNDLRLSLRKI
ncbi:MAG: hypothetical protein A2Z49_12640 [Chloroflexi bacterium RBG_19FT_COMBO_56_12]|nr:MAG: hypothetical protein A2Z49_12640 [Chloroflexi bacterium RBG_19FT_COMBO_56_12]